MGELSWNVDDFLATSRRLVRVGSAPDGALDRPDPWELILRVSHFVAASSRGWASWAQRRNRVAVAANARSEVKPSMRIGPWAVTRGIPL